MTTNKLSKFQRTAYIVLFAVASSTLISHKGFTQEDELLAGSRAAAKALGGQLKSRLQSAMKAGGPIDAIGVCNQEAPKIAADVSGEHQRKVGRTSLGLRNLSNKPDEWELAVLKSFEQRLADGEDVSKIDHGETVASANGQQYRYMKAIPTAEVCLNCHGGSLDDAVAARLDELYPTDAARGYTVGQIRGAFTISTDL